ncbi:RidA family protein [Paraburkholderia pallida]|uniref:RidA family protein n=1 Tax=Paraburkholderia pallida TaxID=2547399 RepID=A0A4P7D7L5_9BURK|nr:RidA family protein [Paraburkholderia pallida]QBR02642.1 RidA family protein [Paraburkholderia pallida]
MKQFKFTGKMATLIVSAAACLAATSSQAKDYVTTPDTQARAYSLSVSSDSPKKTIYFAGQTGHLDADGKPITNFDAQARRAFTLLDQTLRKSGAKLSDVVSMTVFITDVRNGKHFADIRKEFFPDGKFPGSALIAVDGLMGQSMIEIQGVAVVDGK